MRRRRRSAIKPGQVDNGTGTRGLVYIDTKGADSTDRWSWTAPVQGRPQGYRWQRMFEMHH